MRPSLIFFLLLSLSIKIFSQQPFNKFYGEPSSDEGFFNIISTESDEFVISAYTTKNNSGPIAMFINCNGDSVSSYTEFIYGGWSAGYHMLNGERYASTGGYYFQSTNTMDVLLQIIKNNSVISPLLKHYGGSDIDYGRDIEILPDSGFLIVGTTNSFGAGDYDVYIIRTNKNGDSLWTRTYGNSQQGQTAYGIEKESDSVYVVAGFWGSIISNSGQVFIMKINLDGDTLKFLEFGHPNVSDFPKSLCRSSDGGYVVCGGQQNYLGNLSLMNVIYKLDSNFNIKWVKQYGGLYDDEAMDIKECYDHGFIMVGYSEQPGHGEDIYIVRTDSIGDTLWTKTLGGINDDRAYSVVQTPDSGFAIVGNTYSYGAGGSDAFFLKLKPNGETTVSIGLPRENNPIKLSVYPNPADDILVFEFSEMLNTINIRVFDVLGKEVITKEFSHKRKIDIDISSLSSGIYNYEIGKYFKGKFIKK